MPLRGATLNQSKQATRWWWWAHSGHEERKGRKGRSRRIIGGRPMPRPSVRRWKRQRGWDLGATSTWHIGYCDIIGNFEKFPCKLCHNVLNSYCFTVTAVNVHNMPCSHRAGKRRQLANDLPALCYICSAFPNSEALCENPPFNEGIPRARHAADIPFNAWKNVAVMAESLPVGQGSGKACAGVNDGGALRTSGVLQNFFQIEWIKIKHWKYQGLQPFINAHEMGSLFYRWRQSPGHSYPSRHLFNSKVLLRVYSGMEDCSTYSTQDDTGMHKRKGRILRTGRN